MKSNLHQSAPSTTSSQSRPGARDEAPRKGALAVLSVMLSLASISNGAIVVNGDFEIQGAEVTDALAWAGENGTTIARTASGGVGGSAGMLISNVNLTSAAGPVTQNTAFAGGD